MTQTTALISPRTPLLQRLKSHMTHRKTWAVVGLSVFIAGFLTGCGDTPVDASIAVLEYRGEEMAYLVLTSKVDDVVIKGITVNRHNCKILQYGRNPHLGFGQEFKSLLACDKDQVKEAEVETNDGKYTFTF